MFLRILCTALFAMSVPAIAVADTLTWPGSPGCSGTLQACIDVAVDGDRIEIATDAPITESIALHARSLTLTAADGFRPEFVGVGIIANDSGGSGDIDVRLSRLRFTNGYVTATYAGAGTAKFDLRELVLTRAAGATGNGIVVIAHSGTVEAMLYDNRVSGQPLSLNGALVELAALGGTLDARAYYNHVTSSSTGDVDGSGIFVNIINGGGGAVRLHANQVRGGFSRAGIFVSEGLFSSSPSTFDVRLYSNVVVGNGIASGTGIGLTPKDGTIDAQVINNTVTRVRTGLSASNWQDAVTPIVDGIVQNNLFRAERAMFVNPGVTAGLTNDYNLFDGATINFTPGPNTIPGPAGLVSEFEPRAAAGSPAIDAGDTTALALGLIFNGLPVTDADGLRRIKDTGANSVDVGAFEFGDVVFAHTAAPGTISGHITWIDDPAVNGVPGADLFPTPNYNGDPGNPMEDLPDPFGTWYAGGSWTIFNENLADMPPWVDFDVFVPAAGAGVFRHTTSVANVSGWTTQLDHSSLNDLPDRIVLATQNYSAGPVYNPHPIGVFYFSFGGPGAWLIANLDLDPGVDMPTGAGFSVYAQEPSPNAFRVTATAGNSNGSYLRLDHPLLDGIRCARPVATRMFDGTAVAGSFDFDYTADHWHLYGHSGIPLGTQFNVVVNPAQVAACRDVIFADGFDG